MKKIISRITWGGLLYALAALPLHAQDKKEKGTLRLEVAYDQKNDDLPVIRVVARAKVKKKFKPVAGVAVNVFLDHENAEGFLGQVETRADGTNHVPLTPAAAKYWRDHHHFTFIAAVTNNENYEDASAQIDISKARIELLVNEKDSTRTLTAKVLAHNDTAWVPVPGAEVKFVAKRYFSDLPVGGNAVATDDQGLATADYKLTLPGDAEGKIFVAAKLDENETYGTIQTTVPVKWGTPVPPDHLFAQRTLWATRDKTPLWLLIFPNLIIVTVWGFIFYLVYLIVKIRNLGKTTS